MKKKKTRPKIKVFDTVLWIFKLVYSFSPSLIIAIAVIQLFANILPFVEQKYLSNLIDSLIESLTQKTPTWFLIFITFLAVRFSKIAFFHVQRLLQRLLDFRIQNDLRKVYLNAVAKIDYQQLEDKDTANLLSKVQEEYQWRIRQIVTDLFELSSQAISFITVLVLLLPHYWYLALLLVIAEIPGLFVDKKWQKIDWNTFNKYNEKNRPAWDVHWQISNKQYSAELKINQSMDWLKEKFFSSFDEWTSVRIKNRTTKFWPDFATSFFSLSIGGLCMFLIIKDIGSGFLSIGMFTFYFNMIRNTGDYFSSLLNRYVSITEQVLHVNNFRKIVTSKAAITSGKLKKGIPNSPKIEFKNLSFKYPHTDRYIYKNLNLTIEAHEEIAIVGPNGAGKTTLIKLLCRFYDPSEGQILINGVDLREYDLDYWYQKLSLLTQEFNTYHNLSLKENVQIGKTSNNSDSSIISSLKKSEAYSFVKNYKHGLNTLMSQRFGGEEPSWGQWQKIAIARVFHRNAPIMILDEPTASIDAVAESKIFSRLYKSVKNKTIIIISHRFSTVRNAQRIIVIDKGKVLEQGTHQELLKAKGLYAKSFNLQAKGYSS